MKTTLIIGLVLALASCTSNTEKIEQARKEYAHAKKMSKEYYAAGDSEKFLYWMKKELYAGAKLDSLRQVVAAE